MNYPNRKAQDLLHTPEGVRDSYGRENTAKRAAIEKIAEQIKTDRELQDTVEMIFSQIE